MNSISFTIDIDWVNDYVLADTLNIFIDNNIKCTLFATHYSDLLTNLDTDLFEIAIHPNFNPLLNNKSNKNASELIDDLKEIFPNSIGIRSHSLVNSTYLFDTFNQKGFLYESNLLLPYQKLIKPFELWNKLVRIPFNWEDDIHCMYNKNFNSLGIDNNIDDVICNLHPIHIFLNTENLERYFKIRTNYKNTKVLKNAINKTSTLGVRDLLLNQINYIKENKISVLTLEERYLAYKNEG